MMNFGINTFLFTSPFTTESISLFPKFRKYGFDAVEIALEDPAHIDVALVKKALADNGLICCSLCAAMGPGRDLRGSAQEQRNAMEYLNGLMEVMAELEVPVLAGPLYSAVGRAGVTTESDYKKQWDTVVTHLQTLAGVASSMRLKLAVEPLNRYETDFINTCEQAMKLVEDVDNEAMVLLLDTYHMNIEEKDTAKAIKRAGKKLGHFHACGCDRGTPGNDHIAWDPIVAALREIGYDKAVVIESFTQDVKVIAKAASIWRQFELSQEHIAEKGIQFLHSKFR